ncbi:MAG: tetratricopeptide repeat protein [Myxococcales bacterium]|nr:tetratricopeptide repeat protein [Myxococcales bacterium]
MSRPLRRLTQLFALLIALQFVVACMGEPAPVWDLNRLLRVGHDLLEEGRGSEAYNYFVKALKIDPDNYQAHYGIVLALDKRVFANIDGIIDLLSGVYMYEPTTAECEIACQRLEECDLYDEAWTSAESCVQDCPFGLQPYMFDMLSDGSTCYKIRHRALEWIVPTTPENCKLLCENLDLCGNIQPPVTFTVEECISHCPHAYVERHSKCYLSNLGSCNGYDRTCFEHTTVGLQILFREIGIHVAPQIEEYSQFLLDNPNDFQYYLKDFNWTLVDPPVTIDWAGRYNTGYMHLSRMLGHAFNALLLGATSVQLEMNFPNFDLNFNYSNPQGLEEILNALIISLEILLYDPIYPQGFAIYDEDWAYDQVEDMGKELGKMFGEVARMFDFMFTDTDRQPGKALRYEDDNGNNIWDPDEVMQIRGLEIADKQIEINRPQAEAIRDLCYALEANLLERTPVPIELFTGVLESLNLGDFDFLIDLAIAWSEDGTFDISGPFWETNKFAFRELLKVIIEKLKIVLEVVDELGLDI